MRLQANFPGDRTVSLSEHRDRKKAIMNRFDWTFSGSAELVTGLLLAAIIIVAALA